MDDFPLPILLPEDYAEPADSPRYFSVDPALPIIHPRGDGNVSRNEVYPNVLSSDRRRLELAEFVDEFSELGSVHSAEEIRGILEAAEHWVVGVVYPENLIFVFRVYRLGNRLDKRDDPPFLLPLFFPPLSRRHRLGNEAKKAI